MIVPFLSASFWDTRSNYEAEIGDAKHLLSPRSLFETLVKPKAPSCAISADEKQPSVVHRAGFYKILCRSHSTFIEPMFRGILWFAGGWTMITIGRTPVWGTRPRRQAGDIARKHGVIIALETHHDLGTNGDVHLETMKRINHPNIRVNFDTGSIHYYNKNTDAPTELKKIIDYVATVELKYHNSQYQMWNFPALGKGVVDIQGVLRILKKQGYTGPLVIETEGVQGIERNQTEIKRDIADSVAYVRSLGRFE